MSFNLSLNNTAFTLKSSVQTIVSPFLQNFGLNYFQYLRCYDDGSMGLLTNDTRLTEHFHRITDNQPIVFSSYENNQENLSSYWFLWDEKLPNEPVQLAREQCHFYHGITCVRRSKHHYDMIAFALSQERRDSGSYYLSIAHAMESFMRHFDKDHHELITEMDRHRIALPQPYRDENYQKICIRSGKISVSGANGKTYVTTQELACLRWLLQGLSYKEIGKILNISPRTVETYMTRLKQRTGCVSPIALQSLISI